MEVESEQELAAELQAFIDQLIVPLLVARVSGGDEGLVRRNARYLKQNQAVEAAWRLSPDAQTLRN